MNMLEIAKEDVLKSLCRDNPWWDEIHQSRGVAYTLKRAYLRPFAELALEERTSLDRAHGAAPCRQNGHSPPVRCASIAQRISRFEHHVRIS